MYVFRSLCESMSTDGLADLVSKGVFCMETNHCFHVLVGSNPKTL